MSHADDVFRLRARLEAKRAEFLKALQVLASSGIEAMPGGVGDRLFTLLGVITFWQSLPDPSPKQVVNVNRELDRFTVVVAERGTYQT